MDEQKGQAMVETLVALAFVVIPLLLLLPLMHKLSETRHLTTEAAQYAAWERTVWRTAAPTAFPGGAFSYASKADETLFAEVPWRFLQRNGEVITSRYQNQWSWNDKVHPLLKHVMQQGEGQQIMFKSVNDTPDDQSTLDRISRKVTGTRVPGAWGSTVEAAVNALGNLGFKLDKNSFYSAEVSAAIEPFYMDEFKDLNLTFTGHSALLSTGWNAGGPKHAKNLTERLVPFKYADVGIIRAAQNLLAIIPFGKELGTNNLKLGHVDVEVLPPNRLCTYGSPNCGAEGK
ncbi:hypothetical protein [Shewanella cyperi]|uniref:hypothetical protein n=1 Tax=Shewanella cyperi TaxID=2814292 RepID=UPI001A94CB7D|nr:hypothetical protein [Shewanella cyperi]QSX40165.1 hypothetical protein JYB84_14475 [Shewanella cyperi]